MQDPSRHDQIVGALKDVKNNWPGVKNTRMAKNIISKAIKLKKLKMITDGFNKCLGDGKNEKKLAAALYDVVKAIPADEYLKASNCLEGVISNLSVISEEKILNSFAPIGHLNQRRKEKDYQEMVDTRWEEIKVGRDAEKIDDLTEKIESIEDEEREKALSKTEAKKALRDKLYQEVRTQMVHMHGMFNYLLEGKNPKSSAERINDSLKKACPGCSNEEIQKHRESLDKSISNLKKLKVKPVNTERFRNKTQNRIIDVAKTIYQIEERRIYDEEGNRVKRKSASEDFSESRINYHFKPGSNVVSSLQEAEEARKRFYTKKNEMLNSQYAQLSKLGITPDISKVGVKIKEEKDSKGVSTYRMTLKGCNNGECENLFEKEPNNPFELGRSIGETFGMKDFDLDKFKKQRLHSIEEAMANFKKLYDKGSLDELLDKLIMNNPVTAGKLLAEDPENYLQLLCERIKIIGSQKDFDQKLKNTYLNISAALIIGGLIFSGPIGAAPLAGKVLMGSWYALTGVSAYFGVKAYNNEDFAKASCYSGTGDESNCAQIDEYYNDKKYALLFGVMVPGSDLLRIADVAVKAAGAGVSVKRTFDTAASIRGRVITFKGQGENIVAEATHYQAESGIKAVLNLSDEELGQLEHDERVEIVSIIQEVFEKEGDRGVESLVLAIKTIKDLEEDGHIVEKELSGKNLLEEARRIKSRYETN
ncbi:MAG: hypothetical protein ACJAT2_000602 [Bacteriovoracaceae bacterium]|jgi:hypothetical protein